MNGSVVSVLVSDVGIWWNGVLSATMEYLEELVIVDSLMECHEDFVCVSAHS